jgi:pimeloyl-ACP methyl ester carboxylesterase
MKPKHLTRILRITRLAAVLAAFLIVPQFGTISVANEIVTIDRLVSHKSTVPAVAGKSVDLFVREKVSSAILNAPGGRAQPGKVALFVHGGFNPATLAFDVAYRDYSWMTFLARAGYDVFGMDMTGYGQSSRPMMDDPCNLNPRHQERLVPRNLKEPCNPSYPFELVSSDSETADIDRMVDFIRALRGVDKIALIGWSGGGIRTGTYTVRYPGRSTSGSSMPPPTTTARTPMVRRPPFPSRASPWSCRCVRWANVSAGLAPSSARTRSSRACRN